MRRIAIPVVLLVMGVTFGALAPGVLRTEVVVADDDEKVRMLDDCDPADPTWAPTGGCALEEGDVTNAEFGAESGPASGPLSLAVIGHQAWRNSPSYLKIESGDTVTVKNSGGRGHTFTKVANFGGGRVAFLNKGLVPAPECQNSAAAPVLPPGDKVEVSGLNEGNHRFQCCLHPWMRTLIKVKPED